MWTIAKKEMWSLLYNVRFLLTFIVFSLLIILSLINGYLVFHNEEILADENEAQYYSELENSGSYLEFESVAVRRPSRLSIFDMGISNLLPRKISMYMFFSSIPTDRRYEKNIILPLLGELDLRFTVVFFFSLFAILFSHGAISREREEGTLKLIISNPVSRSSLILGKLLGRFIPLALSFIIPLIACLIGLLTFTEVSFSSEEWLKIALLCCGSLMYLVLFLCAGMAISSMTRVSFISFLLCLLFWIFSVSLTPRISTRLASLISPPMDEIELDSNIRRISGPDWLDKWWHEVEKLVAQNPARPGERTPEQVTVFQNRMNKLVRETVAEVDKLKAEFLRRRNKLVDTAVNLSRISPSCCMTFLSGSLSGTGPEAQDIFERDAKRYHEMMTSYMENQGIEEAELIESIEVYVDPAPQEGADGMAVLPSLPENQPRLNLEGRPNFQMSTESLEEIIYRSLPDILILVFCTLILFTTAYVAFLRYDVR